MQKELTRGRIMEAALGLFDELGFDAVTMEDIAHRANLNRGTIYLHFNNKGQILRAIVDSLEGFATLHDPLRKARSREEIDAACRQVFDYWDEKIRMLWRHIRQASVVDAEVAEWFQAVVDTEVKRTQKAFETQGVSRGAARARALLIVAMWTELADRLPASGVDRQDAMRAVAEFFDFARTPTG
jgi:AcrR family transcriptional regulator